MDSDGIAFGPNALPRNFYNFYMANLWDFFCDQTWLGFTPSVISLSGKLLKEKEAKLKEGMRQMGLKDSAFYFAQFVTNFWETSIV